MFINKTILIIVIVLIVGAGGYFFLRGGYQSPTSSLTPVPVVGTEMKEFTVSGTEYSFSPSSITVSVGDQVNITFRNTGRINHNFIIEGLGIGTKTIRGGQTEIIEFTALTSGTYTILCSVPGHWAAGMTGSLKVE